MRQTVYVANSESQQIHIWDLNSDGLLTLIQIVNVPGEACTMVVSVNKHFLYVGVRPNFRLITYRINQLNGKLTWISDLPLPGSPTHVSTDYYGRFIFSSSYSAGCVSVVYLKNNIPNKLIDIIEGLEGCHSANVSLDNLVLWILALKQDLIYLFKIKKNGKLTTQNPILIETTKNAGPRHMVFHPNRKFAYVINELNSSVDVWQIEYPEKKIFCVQTIDIMPSEFSKVRWASDIHITPNGKYLYACDRVTSLITVFSILKEGSLLMINSFQDTEIQPRSFAIDHSGQFLIVAGQKSNRIALYKIRYNQGLLNKQATYEVGIGPVWIVINNY